MLKKTGPMLLTLIIFSSLTACGTSGSTPEPSVAVEPTQAVAAEATEVAAEPTATLSLEPTATPVVEPTAAPSPEPTATLPPAPTEAVAKALTAQEFYDLALAEAQAWQADAVLSRLDSGVLKLLDAEGKGEAWTAQFWSPSTKGLFTVALNEGVITGTPATNPDPGVTPDMDAVNLDLKSFLEKAAAAGGNDYLAKGYGVTAGLRPDVLDASIPAWTIIYLEPGQPIPAFTVIMDARSGAVLRASELGG